MKITIKTIAKDVFDIELDPTSNVLDLKEKIATTKEVELSHIKLIYSGRILKDEAQTMEQLGFKEGHFMVMMVKKPKPVKPKEETPQPEPKTTEEPKTETSEQTTEEPKEETPEPKTAEETPKPSEPKTEETGTITGSIPPVQPFPLMDHPQEPQGGPQAQVPDLFAGQTGDGTGNDPTLSDTQIQQLYQILNNDPTISQLLQSYPQLREQLKDPHVLLELLSRVGHPIVDQLNQANPDGEDGPQVVQVTPEEKADLDAIKNHITDVMGPVTHMNEGQFNALIYQAYTMANKDMEMAKNFLINELLEGNI